MARTPAWQARVSSLESLLHAYAMPACIDMVDIDAQGAEYPSSSIPILGERTLRMMSHRVGREHIGLHGDHHADRTLIDLFLKHGWEVRRYMAQQGKPSVAPGRRSVHTLTDLGMIMNGDGILSLVNPRWKCSDGRD